MDATTPPSPLRARVDGNVILTSRILNATPQRILAAFTDGERLARWWGPKDFRNTFHTFEPRAGGRWLFTMHGPDGREWENENVIEAVEPDRIVLRHLPNPVFSLAIVLHPLGDRTVVGWAGSFVSPEAAQGVASYALEANEQNLDRLEAELARDLAS